MAFTYELLNDPLAPLPTGAYGPAGLNDSLLGQGISQPGEVDIFAIELVGLVDYTASVFGKSTLGGSLDNPYVEIWDQSLQPVASGDDSWVLGSDPFVQFKAPYTGTYYVGVTDLNGGTGDYTLSISFAGIPPIP